MGVGVDGTEVVLAYVESELGYEWQRKASLETRAVSLVTANLGLVTLFFALANNTSLLRRLSHGTSHVLLLVALGPVAVSIAMSVVVALPGNYEAPTVEGFERMRVRAATMTAAKAREEVARARVMQLGRAASTGARKARWLSGAFCGLAAAAVCLGASLIMAF